MKWFLVTLNLLLVEYYKGHVAMNPMRSRSHIVHGNDGKHVSKSIKGFPPFKEYDGRFVGSCKGGSVCTPFVSCPAHVRSIDKVYCKTLTGKEGICCTTGRNLTSEKVISVMCY
ncbi:hypothetical protein JTB14_017630 [Gonioctena quinquepunctata]|nr:hypothetical protein JTB14_017630 [Gonioctena quinquepunctata]